MGAQPNFYHLIQLSFNNSIHKKLHINKTMGALAPIPINLATRTQEGTQRVVVQVKGNSGPSYLSKASFTSFFLNITCFCLIFCFICFQIS